MSNLENFNNIYADLAESAYNNRPKNFPPEENSKEWVRFDFSQDAIDNKTGEVLVKGGMNLPSKGNVYLQPTIKDPSVKIKYTGQGSAVDELTKELESRSVFDNAATGFNSYFVTDTKHPKDASQAYLAVRGSDAVALSTLNDWWSNNAKLTLSNTEIPQAKDAQKALQAVLKKIPEDTPLNITGHSLGTMASVQGAARLIQDTLSAMNRLGNIVLFNGPDLTESLKNMGLSEKQMQALGEKVTYYVNPVDIVSMLNQTAPIEKQFGHVYYIVPMDYNSTFDHLGGGPNAHDFGELQLDVNGNPLIASKDFHPELIEAGQKISKLERNTISVLKTLGLSDSAVMSLMNLAGSGNPILKGAAGYKTVMQFKAEYEKIVKDTRKKSKEWDEKAIPKLQSQIRQSSGGQKVALRIELLQTVAQDAIITAQEEVEKVKGVLSASKDTVQSIISEGKSAAYGVAQYLSGSEVTALLEGFNMDTFWNEGTEIDTINAAQEFQNSLAQFSETLMSVSQHIQQTDQEGAAGFNNAFRDVQINWGK
jgi:hypothetical protein